MASARIATTEMTLEAMQFAVQHVLADEGLRGIHVDLQAERMYALRGMVLQLRAYIYGRKVGTDTVRYPANWVEALKDRWLPMWAKQRWPVEYNGWTRKVTDLYPTLAIQGRSPVRHIAVETFNYTWPERREDDE